MKKVSKVLTATLSCLMATTLIMPINAEGEVEKKESVYTVLNSDGSVSSITVSDTLHSDSGFSNYEDKSDLSDVENLKSSDPVNASSGKLIWNTTDTDIYYQGTSNKELPLTVKITYTLDGNELSADDLVGKSGHLKINIKLSNSSKQSYVVNGKTYNLVTPFVTGIGGMFDDDVFSNVTIDNGKVTSDSSHSIVVGVIVPGLKSGLSQVLDTDLMHRLDDYLADEVTIEADVTDFESPTLMMAAATSTDAIKDEFDDIDEFSSIFDKLDDLKEATQELIDGTNSLYDGAVKLNDGVSTLKDGANTLSNGASDLYDGVDKLASKANTLSSYLDQLSSKSSKLRGGMSELAETVLETANTQLTAAGFNEVNWNQINDCRADIDNSGKTCIFNEYAKVTITDDQRAEAKATITEKVKEKVGEKENLEQIVNTLIYVAAKNTDKSLSFEDKINAAATDLMKASALAGEQAYTDANTYAGQLKNNNFNFSEDGNALNKVLTSVRTQSAATVYETTISGIISSVKSAGKDIDATTAGIILAYACNHIVEGQENNVLGETNLGNAIQKILGGEQYTCDNPREDKKVKEAINAKSEQIGQMQLSAVYDTVKTNIVNVLVSTYGESEDAANGDAPLIIAYGATKHDGAYDTSKDTPTAYFTEYVGELVTMKTAQTNMYNANSTDEGKTIVNQALTKVVEDTLNNSMMKVKSQLTGVKQLLDGVNEYTAGVDQIASNTKALPSGTSELLAGAKKLKDGASSLNSGVATLKDGSQQLADGAKTLKEGMQKYNDEGISKLTDNSRISSIEQASDLLEAISKDENNYNNFSGISDGTDGSIKFVFKINGAKKAKSDDTSSETTTTKVSFWQRILNLFKF